MTLWHPATHWVSSWTPFAQYCPATFQALAAPHMELRAATLESKCDDLELRRHCVTVGTGTDNSRVGLVDEHTLRLLDAMRSLNLHGAVVWDLKMQEKFPHSHAFMHEAIYRNLVDALSAAPFPMHVCWIPAQAFSPSCSLGAALGKPALGPLASSLVMASPKHMGWQADPSLLRLPADSSSAYIFHDKVPPRFEPIRRLGRAVQWRQFGPDGSFDYLDAIQYARAGASKEAGCHGQLICANEEDRSYTAPWGTPFTPTELQQLAQHEPEQEAALGVVNGTWPPGAVHFVGSVWHGNEREFMEFASGCKAAGVPLIRHGTKELGAHLKPLVHIDNFEKLVSTAESHALVRQSAFGAAFQGAAHMDGYNSYISDRAMLILSLGQLLVTNNPAIRRLLGSSDPAVLELIVYSPNISQLCAMGQQAASKQREPGNRRAEVRRRLATQMQQHTYVGPAG
jgi:hypothetical protein